MAEPPADRSGYRIGTTRSAESGPEPMSPFDPAFHGVVNEGPLEAEYEARNHDPATWTPIPWGLVAFGVVLGLLFIYVNVYAVLAFGFSVGVSYYLSYFVGMLARWRPGVINYVAGASTGASQVVLGAAYVLPAIFFLTQGEDPAYTMADVPSLWGLIGFLLVGGVFGVLFFQFYRHLWLVERPLPYPGGFDASMELLTIAHDARKGDRATAGRALIAVVLGAILSSIIVILRDLKIGGQALLDRLFGGRYYFEGVMPDTWTFRPFYNGAFYLSPFNVAIGWFVGIRIAGILFAGTLFAHLLPYLDPAARGDAFSLFLVWNSTARTLAAGAITGAGLTALIRLRRVIWKGVHDVFLRGRATHGEIVAKPHVFPGDAMTWLFVGGIVVAFFSLWLAGVPAGPVILLLIVAALLVAVLGLIGAKVAGETAVQAVSPLTLVALLVLLGVFMALGFDGPTLFIMGLSGAAFFATGLVMTTDSLLDFKVAHYIGNPPKRQALVQLSGVIPGIILGTILVWFLSQGIAEGTVTGLTAPFGRVFAAITTAVVTGEIWWAGFLVAAGLGAAIELWTGRGTAFGIGMALQMFIVVPIFIGALLKWAYQRNRAPGEGLRGLGAIAFPTGIFVGDAFTTGIVFALNQWVLS
ncbi:MAG: OPT/YSL family transporter [Euryarchaeota archaeon]|nr:OPT/YSL family transporter [Euryarchaeota archaeon]